jgi:hypothetical protein
MAKMGKLAAIIIITFGLAGCAPSDSKNEQWHKDLLQALQANTEASNAAAAALAANTKALGENTEVANMLTATSARPEVPASKP